MPLVSFHTPQNLMLNLGGAYIPPSRLRQLQEGITDKSRYI